MYMLQLIFNGFQLTIASDSVYRALQVHFKYSHFLFFIDLLFHFQQLTKQMLKHTILVTKHELTMHVHVCVKTVLILLV